jgi:hypothetical protein
MPKTLNSARIGCASLEKLQELFLTQLGLFHDVHERRLVDLFVKRYDCASSVGMS